ncbi:MAG: magnesium transporter [Phycisphaerales bacterium]
MTPERDERDLQDTPTGSTPGAVNGVAAPTPGEDGPQLEDVTADSPDDARVAEMLEHSIDVAAFAPVVQALDPADAADVLEELDAEEAADLLHTMADAQSADDLANMDARFAILILEDLEIDHGIAEPAKYLSRMDPDDAVDILQACSDDLRERLLDALPPDKAVQLEQLARFDPETAGGMMTTDFVKVFMTMTIGEAIDAVRRQADADQSYVYCVDRNERLVGNVELRTLLFTPVDTPVEEVMDRQLDYLRPDTDQEEIASAFDRYDYTVLPVVDRSQRLIGIVTVDDVLDAIRAENTEDAYKMVGAGKNEAVFSSVWEKFRGRFPWLLVNLFTSFIAAMVVLQFDEMISRVVALAVLMPVIANQAGNAGQQSLAVTLRGIVLGEMRSTRVWPLVWRELVLGLLTGAMIGAAVAGIIFTVAATNLVSDVPPQLGWVFAVAMTGSMGVGCLVGSSMPLLIEKLKFDPATASTIFLTMITDSMSFLTFLGLASFFRGLLLPGG